MTPFAYAVAAVLIATPGALALALALAVRARVDAIVRRIDAARQQAPARRRAGFALEPVLRSEQLPEADPSGYVDGPPTPSATLIHYPADPGDAPWA